MVSSDHPEQHSTAQTTAPQPHGGTAPRVGLVMGSDSDWPVMQEAAQVLEELGVSYQADVVSAHRMPHEMIAYGTQAEANGLEVLIAGAGGAAHLPGMLASTTVLPVIGVPVKLKSLEGLDSLLSIAQMPAGIPVATVSINGARNAGLLAARILGLRTTMPRQHKLCVTGCTPSPPSCAMRLMPKANVCAQLWLTVLVTLGKRRPKLATSHTTVGLLPTTKLR